MRAATAKTPQRRPGRPRREQVDARRDHLLDVATGTFIAQGYSAATMDGIALAAGVGKQTIYSRYPDKEALFSAVVKRLAERHIFDAVGAEPSADWEEDLRMRARACLQALLRPEALALYTLLQREGRRFPELVTILQSGARAQFLEPLAAYFRRQRRRGCIRKIAPERAAQLFMHLVMGEINRSLLLNLPPPAADEVDACAEEISALFLRGVAA